MSFRIEVLKGSNAAPYIRTFSEMRLEEFCKFPYLYVGNIEDDLKYAQVYAASSQGMLVIAFQNETIVGIMSGSPLQAQVNILADGRGQMLEEHGIITKEYYYFGEIIVEPAFRKLGVGSQLMTRYMDEVKEMGFPGVLAITSIRPDQHPMRPQNYFEPSKMMSKYGFEKIPIVFPVQWPTLQMDGSVKTDVNEIACWIKTNVL